MVIKAVSIIDLLFTLLLPDINECQIHSENLCSDLCIDEERTYTCNCPEGKTLAQDDINCGGMLLL